MFKECPHPDENQRMHLSRELGLEPRQIKFWFQNRRTQMKVHIPSCTKGCHACHHHLFLVFHSIPFLSGATAI
jgi:hypothetical protein